MKTVHLILVAIQLPDFAVQIEEALILFPVPIEVHDTDGVKGRTPHVGEDTFVILLAKSLGHFLQPGDRAGEERDEQAENQARQRPDLTGTGFDSFAAACTDNDDVGGGTGWLNMAGNVTPGETMEIRFVIWDTADSVWDSAVLLDDWQWSVQAADPGVTPG